MAQDDKKTNKTLNKAPSTSKNNDAGRAMACDNKTQLAETDVADENFENDQDVQSLKDKLAVAQKEARENYERLLRASAELDNFKKRTQRETDALRKYANETLVRELLTVMDNLERAIASAKQPDCSVADLAKGVELTMDELKKIFERFKVTPIEALQQPFDPNYHQAVMRQETNEHADNTVVNVMQAGYMIHDRLLRPSMVVVAKEAPGATGNGPDSANSTEDNS